MLHIYAYVCTGQKKLIKGDGRKVLNNIMQHRRENRLYLGGLVETFRAMDRMSRAKGGAYFFIELQKMECKAINNLEESRVDDSRALHEDEELHERGSNETLELEGEDQLEEIDYEDGINQMAGRWTESQDDDGLFGAISVKDNNEHASFPDLVVTKVPCLCYELAAGSVTAVRAWEIGSVIKKVAPP